MIHQADSTVLTEAMEQIIEHGLDGFSDAMTIVLNEAMRIERSRVLRAAPWERTEQRQGYANGYKDKPIVNSLDDKEIRNPSATVKNKTLVTDEDHEGFSNLVAMQGLEPRTLRI